MFPDVAREQITSRGIGNGILADHSVRHRRRTADALANMLELAPGRAVHRA